MLWTLMRNRIVGKSIGDVLLKRVTHVISGCKTPIPQLVLYGDWESVNRPLL